MFVTTFIFFILGLAMLFTKIFPLWNKPGQIEYNLEKLRVAWGFWYLGNGIVAMFIAILEQQGRFIVTTLLLSAFTLTNLVAVLYAQNSKTFKLPN
ncbi:MAG: hypothetical protein FWF59_13445 [Turicibacter sp.]|nr:hypothetical protein [Turicibacter sp.]